jgi:surface polysaccharide O-acyltransferase-like enzyme
MKERDSNIELLRIVAMILVMVVHASFLAIGVPQTIDAISLPIPTYYSFFVEAVSVVCVNVFILISGLVWNKC